MINVVNLSKEFASGWAINNISLSIAAGEKISLFGPNGAGKTTFLRILACLTQPSSGYFTILGFGPEQRINILKHLGMAPQSGQFYDGLTVKQNLEFYGKMYGLGSQQLEQKINDLLEQFNLSAKLNLPISQLSKGMRQRLLIIKALLHDPQILLLDEPFSGLDLESAEYLAVFLDGFVSKTIITATHDFDYGVKEGQRVIIFNQAAIIVDQIWEQGVGEFRDFYRREVGR